MFNFAFMPDVGMYLWIPTPCLNAFWHVRPYILLHFWKCFYYLWDFGVTASFLTKVEHIGS